MKTSELTGVALDWAVAKCEHPEWTERMSPPNAAYVSHHSTDWAQGGPIIEREGIDVASMGAAGWSSTGFRNTQFGPTPLIAAMRCYVASRLGDDITIPKELTS